MHNGISKMQIELTFFNFKIYSNGNETEVRQYLQNTTSNQQK
jgi:hypothetical protein